MSAFLRCFSRPSIPSSKPNGAWFSLLRGAAKSCLPVDGKPKQEKIVDGHASFPNDINRLRAICPRVIHPNENRRGGHSCATLSSKMRRGGACVPARTSAQRRFHAKNIRIVCGDFNDGCAPAGRHGRAHRLRPYPSPSYFSTQSHTNNITIYA